MKNVHLAELNVGRLLAATDDPKVKEFMENLDRINGLGKRMGAHQRLPEPAFYPITYSKG